MPSSTAHKRKTKESPKTPGRGVEVRAKRFRRDGVKTPNTGLRALIKKKAILDGCGLCGCKLVDDNGRLLPKSRLDHCHRAEAPNGVGFLRWYLCVSCNALEGYYKWTKVSNADERLASAVRRKHGVPCTTQHVFDFRNPVRRLF